jgi:hypothetical protein
MKQNNLRTMFIPATLLLALGVAFGQDKGSTAKIPFAFRASGSDLPAGRYTVLQTGNSVNVEIKSRDTGRSTYIQGKAPITESGGGRARLIFQCVEGEEGCSLARVWSGDGSGLELRTPGLTPSQRERRETIYLDRLHEK